MKGDFMHRPNKDQYYLGIAHVVSKRSTCLRRHYGAVIVKDDIIISTGYNGSPRGEPNCCDTGDCKRVGIEHNHADYSMCNAVHAEMNAMLSPRRSDMIGSTLYLYGEDKDGNTTFDAKPCNICMNLIKNSGIAKIVNSAQKEEDKIDRT